MKFLKKIFIVCLCLSMAGVPHYGVSAEEENRSAQIGDINADGKIDTLDYVLLKKHLSGQSEITDPSVLDVCDVNRNGEVEDRDLLRLKNIVYYDDVEDMELNVSSKEIHTKYQRALLEEGYESFKTNCRGGEGAEPIYLDFGPEIISEASSYTVRVSEKPDMSDAKTYTSSSRQVRIDNSKVQTLYFWKVSNSKMTSTMQAFYVDDVPVANFSITTIGNARDFGGFETEDGFLVKKGMLYRGYMMSEDSKLQKNRDILINDIGIQTEIDIKEKQSDSSIYYNTSELNRKPNSDFEHYLRRYLDYDMYSGYLNPSANYDSLPNVFKIFEDLADESNYPIYIHCRIGADRTGFMCFLINALCGVSLEDCYLDYTFTTYAGHQRNHYSISEAYVKQIEMTEGRTFAEKTKNLLLKVARTYANKNKNKIGMSADEYVEWLSDNIDAMTAILKERKPSTKTYLKYPKAVSTVLLCNGSEQTFEIEDDYLFNVSGNKATAEGEYTAVISLKDPYTYSWADGSKSDITLNWRISDERAYVDAPVVEEAQFTYNGEEQKLAIEEQEYYTIQDSAKTDAGEYEAIVSLTDKTKYMWADGSSDDLKFTWKIEPAQIDVSSIILEDVTYIYDGQEKVLEYNGELPEGIASVEYSENKTIGHPNELTKLEVTMSFVTESENYVVPEAKSAILTIEPLFTQFNVELDEDLSDELNEVSTLAIVYGQEYELPVCHKEGYEFLGWCIMINGKPVIVENKGIWQYATKDETVKLIPLFGSNEELETNISEQEGKIQIELNEEGEGVALIMESDMPLTDEDLSQASIIGLYKMSSNARFNIETAEENFKYYYLVLDGKIIRELVETLPEEEAQ